MALNFNELPTTKPNTTIPAGRYTAVVASAEMRKAKDPNKPDYLRMRLDIFDNYVYAYLLNFCNLLDRHKNCRKSRKLSTYPQ